MRPLVVGVGHPDRGDDAVGPLVADAVRRTGGDVDVTTVMAPLQLLDAWADREVVVVVDAVRSGRSAGAVTVVRTDAPLPVPTGATGSHGFGVAEAVELARAVDRLPPRLTVVGIEAATFDTGGGMSRPVRRAVEEAARAVGRVLAEAGAREAGAD
ncbi:MAG TPA: hydrogenase maturation protease [Mycobacteriales bacterium]|nr:hydrogenase maturation protease [Mycobacteriales bacterium]